MLPLKDNIPTERFPLITVLLILINVAVFAWQLTAPDSAGPGGLSGFDRRVIEYGAIPKEVTSPGTDCGVSDQQVVCRKGTDFGILQLPALLTLLTSMFMHGGILHIAGNMLFLWIFGNNVEDSMGRARFVLFYLLGGLVAIGSQIAWAPDSTVPTVGASGAIAAVLGAYALMYPRARVLTAVFIIFFFTLIEIPAFVALGFWFATQFLEPIGQLATRGVGDQGGVAYFAHIGGFAFGLALIRVFATRDKQWEPRPKFPVY